MGDVPRYGRWWGRRSVVPHGLKSTRWSRGSHFFLRPGVKLLISLRLRDADSPLALQNIVSKGLRSKILRNKELATQLAPTAAPEWLGLGCTIHCALSIHSVKVVRHTDEFSLFRTVENHPTDTAGLGDLASLPCARQLQRDVRGGWCG